MTIEIGGPSSGGGLYCGGSCGGSGDRGGGSLRNAGRRFGPPPAFLTKTFDMVNDTNTNSIISWGKFGDSFIIWDHIKFSAEILPNYFRHNNFSSFVYQLNNYGFRKIGVDHQWEYTNPDFQEGKSHLLSNMKRRSVLQNPTPRRQKISLCPETLSKSMEESRREMKKLKQQQSETEFKIVELRQVANKMEATSKKLVAQWAKACEIIVNREKAAVAVEIPPQENEVVEKQTVVSSSAADDEPRSASAMMIGDYVVELDNVKKRLFEEEDDDYGVEAANHRDAIVQYFEEWFIQSKIL